jgi:outer membrane protein assembly factor BamD
MGRRTVLNPNLILTRSRFLLKRPNPTIRDAFALVTLLWFAVGFFPGCAAVNKLHHPEPGLQFAPGEQPDKVLYQKALNEITHGRYDVGRLTLQTLINTYPDSEYLSRAKLSIANSYYNEGGVSGLTQAEAEYKDFITFFPTAPEAPEAQFRVGMAHYRLMAKADRDQTEAKLADAEFKEFLLKYPDSPLIPRVKRRLRQVQEVLAQGEFLTANFYYMHGAYPAARSRFQEITDKYPDFSGGDHALYYLGQSLERLKKGQEAAPYYAQVITDFPLSPLVPQAKERLTALKQPIPRPTRAMLARARADSSHRVQRDWLSRMGGMVSSGPDTSATLFGPVHLGTTGEGSIQAAKAPPTVVPPPSAAVIASPASEKSLEAGKPVETSASSHNDTGTAKESTSDKNSPSGTESAAATKHRSRFHVLKKIVMPF